jgi:hypothetical protein
MLIAVLCEVISKKSEEERNYLHDAELRMTLEAAFVSVDVDMDGCITESEWDRLKSVPLMRGCLERRGVQSNYLDDQLEKMRVSIFRQTSESEQKEGLDFQEFMARMIDVQPHRPGTILEVEVLKTRHCHRTHRLVSGMSSIRSDLRKIAESHGIEIDHQKRQRELLLKQVPTQQLLDLLSSRQPLPPESAPALLPPAFPTQADEISEITRSTNAMDVLQRERNLVQEHPFFKLFLGRYVNWDSARRIAALLEQGPLSFLELSRYANISNEELQGLLGSLPEIFDSKSVPGKIAVHELVDHVHGCPMHHLSSALVSSSCCQCAWRLCDALLHCRQRAIDIT